MLTEFLAGCWRAAPPPLHISAAELEQAAPRLSDPHVAALGWRRIQHTELRSLPAAQNLLRIARATFLRNRTVAVEIARIFALLRGTGVEPILIKGWASARHYAVPELRGFGDIDLVILPSQAAAARALLAGRTDVDLDHLEFAALSESAIEEISARSELVSMNGASIRVLGPEDHLSLLCRHLGRHLAAYPVGLCDVAAAIESMPATFDWERCLGTSARDAHWIECTMKLAQELLGARGNSTVRLPRWLAPTVLKHWGVKPGPIQPIAKTVDRPLRSLLDRWPSPLKATVLLGRKVTDAPRLPYQALWFANLALRFVQRAVAPARMLRHLQLRRGSRGVHP